MTHEYWHSLTIAEEYQGTLMVESSGMVKDDNNTIHGLSHVQVNKRL